jgi:hypothetical protein
VNLFLTPVSPPRILDYDPPHLHAEYQGNKAVFDFNGNVMKGTSNLMMAEVATWTSPITLEEGLFLSLCGIGRSSRKRG